MLDSKKCCGCTACQSVCPQEAITMLLDNKGFMYPHVNESACSDCGLCRIVCPIIQRKNFEMVNSNEQQYFALRHKNDEVLCHSSSGGAFFALAQYVLKRNGVVVGAAYDENMRVVHVFADSEIECQQFQGSKYAQSDIHGVFQGVKKLLNKGKLILFSGTPCQNAGLSAFLQKKYDNLITVDIICHSIPSPKIFREYLNELEKKYDNKIINISMRDKTHGWGAFSSYLYVFESGKHIINPNGIRGWQEIFESGYITRECCFSCPFVSMHRVTDFTIGDFWDFDKKRIDLYSSKGTSSILVNTQNAKNILKELRKYVDLFELSYDEVQQPRLRTPLIKPQDYDVFWTLYHQKGFRTCLNTFFPMPSKFHRIVSKVIHKIFR